MSAVLRIVLGSILVLCAWIATARAEGAHVRAAVLVASAQDRALTERVRGQTSDLDAEIRVVDAGLVAPTFEARMREADAVVRRASADAVIWFRVTRGTVVVYVSVPAQDRVLVRSLGSGAGKPSSSTLEAAALVVRDVIRALGQGATVGELRDPPGGSDDDQPPLPLFGCIASVCAAPAPPLVLAAPQRERRHALAFVSSAGWQSVRARDASSLMNALDLRMGLRHRALSASIVLTLGAVDVERVTERADLLVRRHSLGLTVGVTKPIARDVLGSLGLTAGAVSFVRASRSLSPAFVPTETRQHVRPFVGPEARMAWTLAPPLALALTIGLDILVDSPRFEVATVPGRTGVYALAGIQPRLGLAIEWSSSKYH